ncbi:unnamed protein product [Phytophthora fragariaefolia]|uniref:Unnamed protein product n=1 Tax=Phytophthora fragariaefolia TaxID=1490495 RepID=A0A9W6YBM2_9STRA|nr:unnamed protein product [Phytophthora fragariaefolia]
MDIGVPGLDELNETKGGSWSGGGGSCTRELLDTESSPTSTVQKPQSTKLNQGPRRKRRVRSAETSSTGLQRRKRAELASLREQAVELENVLARIKDGVAAFVQPSGDSEISQWHRNAVEQGRLRLQAERTNRRLKAILKNQAKVRQAISSVLQKPSTLYVSNLVHFFTERGNSNGLNLCLQGMDYLMRNEVSRIGTSLSRYSFSDAAITELEQIIERLCRTSRTLFDESSHSSCVNISMLGKYDEERHANVIEFETSTPLG